VKKKPGGNLASLELLENIFLRKIANLLKVVGQE